MSISQILLLQQKQALTASQLVDIFQSKIAKSQAVGKDGIRMPWFIENLHEQANLIETKISNGTYHFTTYKERLLLRGHDRSPRQISIPTIRDRLTIRALCGILHHTVPQSRGSAPHTLIKQVVEVIRKPSGLQQSFVRIDVKDFFPSVSHAILGKELNRHNLHDRVVQLCLQAIRTGSGSHTKPNLRGIPQGLSISNALSAIFMLNFDKLRSLKYDHYFRYVDDILLIVPSNRADDVLRDITRALSSRGLKAHSKGSAGKTEISPVVAGIDFLGYKICPSKVSIRASSFKRMFKNLLKVITDYRYSRDIDKLLFRLNLKISGCVVDGKRRGWIMFFAYTEDLSQLQHLDAFVRSQLKRVGFSQEKIKLVKTLTKSYHEVRFGLDKTKYIPNFDEYSDEQKSKAVAALSKFTPEEVATWNAERISQEFSRLVSYEVHDLEHDVGSPS